MVKNNMMNIIESVSNNLSLRAGCLKLEIDIIWERDTILKMYEHINKLIEDNKQKLNNYKDIELQTKTIHKQIVNELNDNIVYTYSKIKMKIFNQIQKHNNTKQITEDKFMYLCTLNNNLTVTEELLVNRLGLVNFLISISS